jgi:hypothetical protein
MLRLPRFATVAALAVAALSGAFTQAHAKYDTPSARIVTATRSSITLEITAGQSGAPAGFSVQWMRGADYAQHGWDPIYSYVYVCDLYGTPTWNTLPGDGSFAVGPGGVVTAELGDMFDETGVYTDNYNYYDPAMDYVFRVRAVGDANNTESDFSLTQSGSTSPTGSDCTFTIGYWKNHGPGDCSGGGNANAWPVASLTIGCQVYTAAELCALLNTSAGGNGLLQLMHQLIAAKLNIANGADGSPVAADIAAGDAILCGYAKLPGPTAPPSAVQPYAQNLDNYNNGLTTVPHCGQTPAQKSTWGSVKVRYH